MVYVSLSAGLPLVHEPGKLPNRFKILQWGDNKNANRVAVRVGQQLVDAMAAAVYPFKVVALDWNHNTCPGTPAYAETKEPRDVAGYGRIEVVPNDGVYMVMTAWTPQGIEKAQNFLDVSAAPLTDKAGNVVAIPSVALCRTGAVPEMEFKQVAMSVFTLNPNQKEKQMDPKKILLSLLGLDDSADDATIEKAAASFLEAQKKPAAPAPQPLSAETLKAAIEAAVTPLSAEISGLKAANVSAEKQRMVEMARMDGKVIALSADGLAQISLAALADVVKATPVTVPLAARTPGAMKEETILAKGPSESDRQIALSCGMDPDKVFPAAIQKEVTK